MFLHSSERERERERENRERPNVHFAQLAINIQENDRDKRDMDWCFYLEKSYRKEKYSKVNFAER